MIHAEKKTYVSPEVITFGRLENLTQIYSNQVTTDNACPGAVGSLSVNSGTFCAGGGGGGEGGSSEVVTGLPVDPAPIEQIIIPTLIPELPGEELVGGASGG